MGKEELRRESEQTPAHAFSFMSVDAFSGARVTFPCLSEEPEVWAEGTEED